MIILRQKCYNNSDLEITKKGLMLVANLKPKVKAIEGKPLVGIVSRLKRERKNLEGK